MADIIRKLSTITSNQIAAGEVVKRPSSIVKELMENAIDADSTMIIVNVSDGGKELIQVIDDGKGMSFNDALLAFERHATSKITTTDDIYALRTFGFRGEALASIASVAQVELMTSRDEDQTGCRVLISGGELESHTSEVTNKGTQVSVRKLFYNVPQRRSFLKKTVPEFNYIVMEFKKVALCNPSISMFLYHNNRCIFNLPVDTLRSRVNNIIGKNLNGQLMEIDVSTSIVSVQGYLGSPETAVQQPEQFMFVNGRYFRMPYFNKAVNRAYENLLPSNKVYPRYFLYFTVDPSEIDVNADPEKVDVKFENETQIWQILFTSIKAVLGKNGITPMIDFEISGSIDGDTNSESFKAIANEVMRDESYNPFDEKFSFSTAIGHQEDIPDYKLYDLASFESTSDREIIGVGSSSPEESYAGVGVEPITQKEPYEIISTSFESVDTLVNSFEASDDSILSASFLDFGSSAEQKEIFEIDSLVDFGSPSSYDTSLLGACTLFDNRYIIAPMGERVLFVKISSALRRICYDKYDKLVRKESSTTVNKLMFPTTIPLSADYRAVVMDSLEDLRNIGFEISHSLQGEQSDNTIEITGIPDGYDKYNLYEVFEEILAAISGDDIDGYNLQKRNALIIRLSSVEALKRSKNLKPEELCPLVRELFECQNFKQCPKGKSIFAELNKQSIDQLLK